MYTRTHPTNGKRKSRAFSLVEVMISTALFSVAAAVVMAVFLYSSKTFAVLASYAELDQNNRNALDTMTKELRSAQYVVTNTQNSISFINKDGAGVTYQFQPATKQLLRSVNGGAGSVLLDNCSLLSFNVGIRVPNTNFDFYPWPTNEPSVEIKAIQLSWKAQKVVPGLANTVSEDVQTAKVVIRAAGTGAL